MFVLLVNVSVVYLDWLGSILREKDWETWSCCARVSLIMPYDYGCAFMWSVWKGFLEQTNCVQLTNSNLYLWSQMLLLIWHEMRSGLGWHFYLCFCLSMSEWSWFSGVGCPSREQWVGDYQWDWNQGDLLTFFGGELSLIVCLFVKIYRVPTCFPLTQPKMTSQWLLWCYTTTMYSLPTYMDTT